MHKTAIKNLKYYLVDLHPGSHPKLVNPIIVLYLWLLTDNNNSMRFLYLSDPKTSPS